MSFVVLFNPNNAVGEEILKIFRGDKNSLFALIPPWLGKENTSSLALTEMEDVPADTYNDNFEETIRSELQENNIFIFNSEFIDECKAMSKGYADKLSLKLKFIFKIVKSLCKLLIGKNKGGKFFFITVNPGVSNILDFPTAPIYDEAIHSFLRSLAKEFNPFNLIFNGLCVEPVLELMDKSELRTYRNKMKIYAMKKDPIKAQELAAFIKNISINNLSLSSGNIYCLGQGMPLPY